jgi:hypothetical protein
MFSNHNVENKRHSTFYFDDGDVTLLAFESDSPRSRGVFKIHRILFAHYSEVFRNIFVVGGTSSKAYYNVLLVAMPPDDIAEGVESFLETI